MKLKEILENMGLAMLQFSSLHIAKGCTDEELNKKCDKLVDQAETQIKALHTIDQGEIEKILEEFRYNTNVYLGPGRPKQLAELITKYINTREE